MSPTELVEAAVFLVEAADPGTAGLWPRAAALLGRQALESALDGFWAAHEPGAEAASTRAKLLCLTEYLDDRELAEDIGLAWSLLTRGCHHHAYELAPTQGELLTWLQLAIRAVAELQR